MTARRCNAASPTVRVGDAEPASYQCELPAYHYYEADGGFYHRNGLLTWRDPTDVLGESKPWHPNHRPHSG
jgi:hypothetical protein